MLCITIQFVRTLVLLWVSCADESRVRGVVSAQRRTLAVVCFCGEGVVRLIVYSRDASLSSSWEESAIEPWKTPSV